MPTTPSASEFVMRYAPFADVPPDELEDRLAEAADSFDVDVLGSERTWRQAVMLRAAHDLTTAGFGTGVEAALIRQGLAGFTSVSDGAVSASRPAASGADAFGSSYGAALAELLRRAIIPAVVAGTDTTECPYGSPVLPCRS